MPKIWTPGNDAGMTPKQAAATINQDEMPPCVGNPGTPCNTTPQPVMISGYDDKMRCPPCNKIHIALVEQEAGDSNPNTPPKSVSPRLNAKVEARRQQAFDNINASLEKRGMVHKYGSKETVAANMPVAEPGDPRDMKDAMTRDEHGTRDDGITESERRARIYNKYNVRKGGA